MQPEKPATVQEWLQLAERDILAADQSLHGAAHLYEDTAFHSQQAAEKAFKAFLTAHDREFSETHDLTFLVNQCSPIDQAFQRFADAARVLTPYAVLFRYPGGPPAPSRADAAQALRLATEILGFVRRKLGLERSASGH